MAKRRKRVTRRRKATGRRKTTRRKTTRRKATRRRKATGRRKATRRKKKATKGKQTNVDRLHKAGALKVAKKRLSPKHHGALNRLTKSEVDALIKVHKKVGKVKAPPGKSQAWLV